MTNGNTFASVAYKWFHKTKMTEKWSQKTIEIREGRFKNYLFPVIGNRLINTLKLKDFIEVINKSIDNNSHVPSRVRADIMCVMRYAILNNINDTNPAVDLAGLKLTAKINHHPALPLQRLGELDNKILTSDTQRIIQLITLIHLYVFVRSSELRFARWSEIDFDNKLWTIPEIRSVCCVMVFFYFTFIFIVLLFFISFFYSIKQWISRSQR